MNWFTKSADTLIPIVDIAPPGKLRNPEKARAYEVVIYDNGQIAVIGPDGREIKRRETPTNDWPTEEVIRHVVNDAINRINFIESSYIIVRYKKG